MGGRSRWDIVVKSAHLQALGREFDVYFPCGKFAVGVGAMCCQARETALAEWQTSRLCVTLPQVSGLLTLSGAAPQRKQKDDDEGPHHRTFIICFCPSAIDMQSHVVGMIAAPIEALRGGRDPTAPHQRRRASAPIHTPRAAAAPTAAFTATSRQFQTGCGARQGVYVHGGAAPGVKQALGRLGCACRGVDGLLSALKASAMSEKLGGMRRQAGRHAQRCPCLHMLWCVASSACAASRSA